MLLLLVITREKFQGLMGALRSIGVSDYLVWLSWLVIAIATYAFAVPLMLSVAHLLNLHILDDSNTWVLQYFVFVSAGVAVFCNLMVFVAIFNRPKVVIGMFGVMFIVTIIFAGITSDDTLFSPTSSSGMLYGIIFPCFHVQKFLYRMSLFANETIEAPLTPVALQKYDASYFFEGVGRCVYNETDLTLPCIKAPLLVIPREIREARWYDDAAPEYVDCRDFRVKDWYDQFLENVESNNTEEYNHLNYHLKNKIQAYNPSQCFICVSGLVFPL